MSWDLFVMDLPKDLKTADALPENWVPRPLPPRQDIVCAILDIDPTADASDPAWVRVNGRDFSVEISISGETPLTGFACHIRGGDPAVGFIATLLERLHLRALDPGSDSGLFDPATAVASQTRWREYRDHVVTEQLMVSQKASPGSGAPFRVVARIAESIQPVARGTKYEDPLGAVLRQQGRGQVKGGGSQLNEPLEIAYVEVEMMLANLEGALALARTTLLTLGAPPGSALYFQRDGRPRTLPIHGNGPETDCPETVFALARQPVVTPKPSPTVEDSAVIKVKAAKFLAAFERLFLAHPETVPADLSNCDAATVAWYDAVTREFAAEGFHMLGNFTTAEIAARKDSLVSAFSRKFLSTDGRIRATAVLIASAKPGQAPKPVLGMSSELDDGTFLRTAAMPAEKWDRPDHLLVEYLTPDTPIPVIAARHRARLQPYLLPAASDRVSIMRSLEDVFASEARSQSLSSAFRRQRGIPSIDEILRFGVARSIAELMHGEMRVLMARRSNHEG